MNSHEHHCFGWNLIPERWSKVFERRRENRWEVKLRFA